MKKILISVLCSMSLLGAAVIDSDYDGVEDSKDKCPKTSFTDIVDVNGCSIKSLIKTKSKHKFNMTTGLNYLSEPTSDTIVNDIKFGYRYDNISISVSGAYYNLKSDTATQGGILDIYIGAGYKIKATDDLSFNLSAGVYLPTYTADPNNNTDYSLGIGANYKINKFNLFANYSYTFVGDTDTATIEYINTSSYLGGVGYLLTNNLYVSTYYSQSSSIYNVNNINIESISASAVYYFDRTFYTQIKYGKGLNTSSVDNTMYLSVGINF